MADLSQLSNAQLLALASQGSPTSPPPSSLTGPPPSPNDPFSPGFDLTKATNAQLQRYAADTNTHMSTGEDIARSSVGGAQRGVAGTVSAQKGIADTGQSLAQGAVDFLSRHGLAPAGTKVPSIGDMTNPFGHALPSPGQLVQGVTRAGVKTLDSYLPAWAQADPTLAQAAVGMINPSFAMAGPSPEQTAVAMNGGVPIHKPQTTAGRYAQRIAEFAPMVTTPGSVPQRLASMIVPGVASQGAEDIAPPGWKAPAAVLGAMAGGGAVALGSHMSQAPAASFGNAAGQLTDDQIAQAQQLRTDAAQRGLTLTLPEAVQQVTENGTGLGRLQRVIESTKQGQALTAPYFADRPAQVSAAVRALADTIAPATDQPSMIGVQAQGAATGALDQARQVVNQVAGPDYTALSGQTMDPEAYQALSSNPSYQAALANLRGHPELGATVAHLPDSNLSVINAVKQRLATMGEQAQGTPLQPGDNQLAGLRFGARGLADQLARSASPEYATANDTVRQLSGQYVDPLRAGPLGAISATQDVPAQAGALYPRNPLEGAPNETAQAIRVLGAAAPGVAEDLTRQHLVNALDSSMRNLQGGQNQYAGAKLAVALAGSPEQAATLRAGVGALPDGAAKASDLGNLIQALEATGKRQQPGSMTAFNESDLKDLHIAPYAQAIGRIGDPLTWGAGIGDILNRANYRRNISHLADMIMAEPEQSSAVLQAARSAARPGVNPLLPALIAQPRRPH